MNTRANSTDKDACAILIVDDDQSFRNAHERLLTLPMNDRSFIIATASTGAQALAALSESAIDCVLLDYVLEGEDGLKLAQEIMRRHPLLPVIMLTGVGSEHLAAEAMKSGVSDYLVKSEISRENLVASIDKAIERSGLLCTIEQQQKELFATERFRVMSKSLAAACHHLGQPLTVLKMTLSALQNTLELEQPDSDMLEEATAAADKMGVVIDTLRHVACYKTEAYLTGYDGTSMGVENEILSIEEPAHEDTAIG